MISLSVLTPPASLPWTICNMRTGLLDRFCEESAGHAAGKVAQPKNVETPDDERSGSRKDNELTGDARQRAHDGDLVEEDIRAEHDRGDRRNAQQTRKRDRHAWPRYEEYAACGDLSAGRGPGGAEDSVVRNQSCGEQASHREQQRCGEELIDARPCAKKDPAQKRRAEEE